MPRPSSAPAALLFTLLASLPTAAAAQVQHVAPTWPAGLALPVLGAAGAEEATALSVNPAGIGLVGAPALHYQHQQATEDGGAGGDGLYAAGLLGPVGPGLAVEWVRPAAGAGPSYRLTTFGLALSDGRVASLGVAWRWWSSPDAALEAMHAWDLGLTVRPARWLSLGASAQGLDARLDGVRQPARYDLGLATRLAGDALTLSADLLADDADGSPFRAIQAAAGAQLELRSGLVLSAQVRWPLPEATGSERGLASLLALSWNAPQVGATVGAASHDGDTSLLAGLRLSRERYRAAPARSEVPALDLGELLAPRRFLFLALGEQDRYGALLERLEQARLDREVSAVLLEVDALPLGDGRVEELRAAVLRLRAEKPVLAYLTGGGTREYWLASAATAVAAPPGSSLTVNGLVRSQVYLRDGLARLGVAVEVARAGAYKAAPEPLTRSGPSDESRAMTAALLDDVSGRLRADLAASRRLAPERVAALLDQGLFTGAEAKEAGLVDELLWPDELEGWTRRRLGRTSAGLVPGWRPAPARTAQRWGAPPAIAVVRLEGTITAGRSRGEPLGDGGLAGAETVTRAIAAAAKDARVRAIVLRVESPGGDAHASELIWREVMLARARKPVVVSMGDLAASGGYLAAVGADLIVAEPSTLTGSIGVFALKPDLSGVLEKLSLGRDVQQRGKTADVASLAKPWSPAERAAVERLIDATYRGFLQKVADGRKLPLAEVEALAGGRVWTGAQALERKLVDRLGGLPEAVALARQRAGVPAGDEVELLWRGGKEPFDLESPAASLSALVAEAAPPSPLLRAAAAVPELRTAALLLELGPVLALPVEWLGPAAP
jgi:protease-4